MEDLRQFFSSESIEKLKNLSARLQSADAFSDSERRKIFRALHTLKGSSQTFGFTSASNLAHRLETILSIVQNKESFNETVKNLFVEGIELLIKSLQEKHFEIPASFVEKIAAVAPDSVEENNNSEMFLPEIPPELSSKLSGQEKNALAAALSKGKTLYGLEVGFGLADFAVEFKNLREILSRSSEIIATLPSAKYNAQGKVGFQIFFASSLQTAQIKKIAETGASEIILDTSENVFPNDLQGVLSQVAKHGRMIAKKFGKQIEFDISADKTEFSTQKLKLIFDVLLHLTRNAVDHAIESAGKIEISLKVEENNLKLSVSDDGRGIDREEIKARAIEKNLISADKNLNKRETLRLIFLPEFSTASHLTEISGRGIGLDAVKSEVEAADGRINVKSQTGRGTTFEIFLPNYEE